RLRAHDYTAPGSYFVTVCAHDRAWLFGQVVDGRVRLSKAGEILRGCWIAIPDHFSFVTLEDCVIMPNHLHGIVVLGTTEKSLSATPPRQSRGPVPRSLGALVGSFKSAVARRINDLSQTRDA